MSENSTIIGFSLLIPVMAGYALYRYLFRRNLLGILSCLSVSYGLGLGILSQWMLILDLLHLDFSLEWIFLPVFLFTGYLIFRTITEQREEDQPHPPYFSDVSRWSVPRLIAYPLLALMLLYIFYVVSYAFWRAMHVPICYWDEVAFIAVKAKVFYYERAIAHLKDLPWPSYPLHVPLVQTWIAICMGEWNEQAVKIIFPFYLVSYLIMHYDFLARFTNKLTATAGVVLLLSANFLAYHATISYNDLVLMYYNCGGVLMLLLWHRTKKSSYLITAAMFGGIMTFVKIEGLLYLMIHVMILLTILSRQKIYSLRARLHFLRFTLFSFGMALLYQVYKLLHHIPPAAERFDIKLAPDHLGRLSVTLQQLAQNIFYSGNWNIIWFLLILSLLFNIPRIRKSLEIQILGIALASFFGLFFMFALAANDTVWAGFNFKNTVSRIILHFYPLSAMLILLLNYPDKRIPMGKTPQDPSE